MIKISEKLWLYTAKRKLNKDNFQTKLNAIQIIGKFANEKYIDVLKTYLDSRQTILRNEAVKAIKSIIARNKCDDGLSEKLMKGFKEFSPIKKIAIIDLLSIFSIKKREKFLQDLIQGSNNDITFICIYAINGTKNIHILDKVLRITLINDFVLKKLAYDVWFTGISKLDENKKGKYCGARLHDLIRATFETNDSGNLLHSILISTKIQEFPIPKAYPEFIFKYIIKLIDKWGYNPQIYSRLHSTMIPAYFSFSNATEEKVQFMKI